MGKGWGLTLDNSDSVGLFSNKPVGFSLTPRLNNNKGIMFTGTEFPVSLNRREDHTVSPPANEPRVVIGEVDFFSDNKKSNDNIVVKKENSPREAALRTDSDVNLAVLQVELERMNAENQRLKGMLSHVSDNYSALRMHIASLMQQQEGSKTESTQEHGTVRVKSEDKKHEVRGLMVPRQFMDLGPSAVAETNEPSQSSSEERTLSVSPKNNIDLPRSKNLSEGKGIDREQESPESQAWVPNKFPKLNPSKPVVDQAMEATMRKARVSVRARSEAPMITDGCQWRKYGQKMAKGNPCPRAYYRCTMAINCPVRKQVQRSAEDRAILITTYEGTHNHPLPPAAMAMASTTSAAANMLLSGSMSSADGIMNPNILARAILPSSSTMATISASAPFPTVTLDLTTQTPNPLQFQRPQTQFQVPQNFSSVSTPPMAQVFGQALYNQSKFSGLQFSHQGMDSAQFRHHPSFTNTLTATTAAIAADPNFTAALAAAITSMIGGAQLNNNNSDIRTTTTTTAANNNNILTTSNKTSSFTGN
ncbi:unnamed protein product [Ilex paraguariensis]|uniref:WRKY domain-containing protein n=1 Tax=Ilex paraguariensis TaxID=185542 RepID=A0ABC8R2Y2_9AQUA